MRSGALVLVFALLSATACDSPANPAVGPTEPTASHAKAVPDGPLKEAVATSTTCSAYQERLDAHQATLKRFPGDQAATEAVATYTSLIADACN